MLVSRRPRSRCLLGVALLLHGWIQKNVYLGRREGMSVPNLIVMCYWCKYESAAQSGVLHGNELGFVSKLSPALKGVKKL